MIQAVSVAGSKASQGSGYVYVTREIDWTAFKEYLSKTCNRNTAKVRMFYAKKYAHVLEDKTLSPNGLGVLSQLSPEKRLNVMKSLTALSKYLGCYDRWQSMRQQYSLKWSSGNESLQSFARFFDDSLTFDTMLQRVKEMIYKTPTQMGNIIKFACLTGLRPSEAVESVRLLRYGHPTIPYYNPERQALEHFRFPEIFFRQTKKAYISLVTPEMIADIYRDTDTSVRIRPDVPSYNAIRLACRKKGINMDMRFCRKIFASYLHKSGISSELIDMLQGRAGKSVFANHYLVPQGTYKDDVLRAIHQLKEEIEQQ